MKKLYAILYAVMLVCLVGTVVFLILSPDRIPAHYDFAGKADRFGSKYEYLLFPLFALALGAFFLLVARAQQKKGVEANAKVLLYASIFTVIFFTLLGSYFMVKALRYDPSSAPEVSYDDVNRFINIGMGVLLMALGNIMPKMRRNGLFGLRTKWSMANDAVWQKSQRFGGISAVIAGLCLIVLSLFLPGAWNILPLTGILLLWIILCVAASRRYYREDRAAQGDQTP